MITTRLFLQDAFGYRACSALFALLLATGACATAASDADLLRKIEDIEQKTHATIGVTAVHIEKDKIIEHNGNKRFFMASTIKLPIAMAFLHRVDENKDSLTRVITLDSKNSVPGSGSLFYAFEKKAMGMSSQNVLRRMLADSDNSASDTILHAANGPEYVTKRMYELGFNNIFVNRSILEMLMDTNHVDHANLGKGLTVAEWKKLFNSTPVKTKAEAWQHFQKDRRDTTTPDDMAGLLVKLYKKQALSESSTDLLIDIMQKCRTGRSRIRGLLPSNVKVAHKTGTWAIDEQNYLRYPGSKELDRFVSDVGIITLPNNQGHVALAVYVKSRAVSNYPRSRAIALISLAVYEHFMGEKVKKPRVWTKLASRIQAKNGNKTKALAAAKNKKKAHVATHTRVKKTTRPLVKKQTVKVKTKPKPIRQAKAKTTRVS